MTICTKVGFAWQSGLVIRLMITSVQISRDN